MTNQNNKTSNLKKILIVVIPLLIVVCGFAAYKMLSPSYDLIVNTDNVEMKIYLKGDLSGKATAEAKIIKGPEYDIHAQDKVSPEKKEMVYDFKKELSDDNLEHEIVLSKTKEIKNGDVIKATLKFKAPKGLKVKFTKDVVETELKVERLSESTENFGKFSKEKQEKIIKTALNLMNEYAGSQYTIDPKPVAVLERETVSWAGDDPPLFIKVMFKLKKIDDEKPYYGVISLELDAVSSDSAKFVKGEDGQEFELFEGNEDFEEIRQTYRMDAYTVVEDIPESLVGPLPKTNASKDNEDKSNED